MVRKSSPDSFKAGSDSETESNPSDFAPSPPAKRPRLSSSKSNASGSKPKSKSVKGEILDIEDLGRTIPRPHGASHHSVQAVGQVQEALLTWFESTREKRGMPWRKRYDPDLSIQEKGQRAYEIWVSEVMLQQTQVATVIDYWKRWMERWPTIADLAKADIEEVNAAWRGLGYYRRARSLLAGAKTVMGEPKYDGRLPKDPAVLEKHVDGVGRYTAGAITSMAYGVRTPIVDGNVHRLLTRLLAVHAGQAAPATIKFLWKAADELVDLLPETKGIAGDWNQALMELGSQICKPVSPDCAACPLRSTCKAHAELSALPQCEGEQCDLCAPVPGSAERIPSVTVFPMKKEKKTSREEHEVVCVLECKGDDEDSRRWLFTKRPEKGLLAGLFEPPTTPIDDSSTPVSRLNACYETVSRSLDIPTTELPAVSTHRDVGNVPHIFSHINMTYHIVHITLTMSSLPTARDSVWLDKAGVESANIGTGVKKVWKEVYGAWGKFDVDSTVIKPAKTVGIKRVKATGKKASVASRTGKNPADDADAAGAEKKIVKRIMMPAMPTKSGA